MASPKALLLHDDARTVALARSLLAGEGFDVALAESRYRLLEVPAEAAPDVLVLGVADFDRDDLEIVGVLRRRWPRAFLLALYPASQRDRAARALDLGADATLQEPFYPGELSAFVRRALRRPGETAAPQEPGVRAALAPASLRPEDDSLTKLAAGAAHSIRNPLQILELQLGTYEADGRLDPAAMREQIARIAAVAEGLTRFSGRRKLHTRLLDLNVLVRRVFVDGPPRARRVHFIPCTERVEVLGAPDLLRAAFEAVHDRAQRETPDGGEVEVATAVVDENGARFAEIRVTDGGKRPPPESLHRVFDPFPDADQVTPGSGIEMAAAAGIVRNHGGSAEARPGVRAGTEVILRLPVYGRIGPARSAAEARA